MVFLCFQMAWSESEFFLSHVIFKWVLMILNNQIKYSSVQFLDKLVGKHYNWIRILLSSSDEIPKIQFLRQSSKVWSLGSLKLWLNSQKHLSSKIARDPSHPRFCSIHRIINLILPPSPLFYRRHSQINTFSNRFVISK